MIYTDCVLLNKSNQVLLLKRKDDDDFMPSKWCVPGGKYDQGNSLLQSACRECLEETGLQVSEPSYYKKYINADGSVSHFYLFNVSDYAIVYLDNLKYPEHEEAKWVSLSTIYDYDMIFDTNDRVIDFLYDSITNNKF